MKSRSTHAIRERLAALSDMAWERIAEAVNGWREAYRRETLADILANCERVVLPSLPGACQNVEYRLKPKLQQSTGEAATAKTSPGARRRKGQQGGPIDFGLLCTLVLINLIALGLVMWLMR